MKTLSNFPVFRITALAAVIGCLLVSCGETPEKEKTVKGTVTANANGEIMFMYSRTLAKHPASCTFTSNLPAPDNQFILSISSGETSAKKTIDDLTEGQKVTWTAKVEGNPLNHGSGNFVHIVND